MKSTTVFLFILTFFCVLNSSALVAQNDNPDQIIGFWESNRGKVEIYKSGTSYIGNPIDGEGNRRPIETLNLTYTNEKWIGKLYLKKNNKTFYVECTTKENILYLNVSGGKSSKSLEWKRIK